MNEDQVKFPICAHCGLRLYAGAKSTLCKSCRFKGHKEFGNCDKCPAKK